MSLKFTKFKQNINHNKKKTRKYYKKTKKKVCVLYGGARRAPKKPSLVKKRVRFFEKLRTNAQTQKQQPKQKSQGPRTIFNKIGSVWSKGFKSFGGVTLGERYKKYNWGVTPPKLKNSSSQVSQKNKSSSEEAIAALEQKLQDNSTVSAQEERETQGKSAESTGPTKPEPPPAGPAKIEPPPAGPPKTPGLSTEPASTTPKTEPASTPPKTETAPTTPKEPQGPKPATPEPSPVPGPKTTGLRGSTPPPVPSRSLKPVEPTVPPVPPRTPIGEEAPLAPALIVPPMPLPPKSDKPLTPLEIKLQNARTNLKKAEIPLQKPLVLPISPATVVLKPVPPKNSTPVPTNTPNIPRTIINITPKESGITTFGNKKENSKSISFVQRAKKNINSGTFTKRSKNTGNVLSQDKKQVVVGELPKISIFGNRVKSKPITQKSNKSVTTNPVIPT